MAFQRTLARTAVGLVGALGLLAACTSPQGTAGTSVPSGTGAAAVSFKNEVAPLLARTCAGCHTAGGQGSRDLVLFKDGQTVDYAAVQGGLRDIIRQVETGRMPQGRAPLTTSEVDLLKSWQAAGAANN